ncbi:DinB family protein [Kribbella jejuensis]|uniref:Putative damage-inducible protein DinB n=1 Tax=Kribbella jejuensis TaxID=236068 RepID=A0A542ETX9_9ACTN|nr:DinB family protein [Kribbella jejuensis]TQJ18770.1 putative damage-inducible protein DinB [Kribbella jejuensis]
MNLRDKRPPIVADERTQLVGWLDLQRMLVRRKLEELRPEDEYRAVLPQSPLMTPAGLVSHMRWTEHCWFNVIFLGEPESSNPQFQDEPESADMRVEGVPLTQLLDEFEAQYAESNRITAAHSLDDVGKDPEYQPSLRWILIHMVEETARHVGHLDAMRELLDGETGYY